MPLGLPAIPLMLISLAATLSGATSGLRAAWPTRLKALRLRWRSEKEREGPKPLAWWQGMLRSRIQMAKQILSESGNDACVCRAVWWLFMGRL